MPVSVFVFTAVSVSDNCVIFSDTVLSGSASSSVTSSRAAAQPQSSTGSNSAKIRTHMAHKYFLLLFFLLLFLFFLFVSIFFMDITHSLSGPSVHTH